MSTTLRAVRGNDAASVRPVEAVAGAAMTAVAGLCVALGAIAFVVAILRGSAATAWEAYLVNLLFFLGIAQGAMVASAAFYLTQAKWGGSTPYRLGEAFVPKGRYLDVEFLTLELAKVFPRTWLMACRVEELPGVGSYVEYRIGDHSILANSTEIAGHCVLDEWVVTNSLSTDRRFYQIQSP